MESGPNGRNWMHKICAEALLKADRERGNLLHVLMLLSSSHITHLRRARRSSVLPDRLIHSPSNARHWHGRHAGMARNFHPRAGRPCNASMLECFACRDDASSKERNRRVARIVSCDRAIRHPTIGIESYMSCIGSHIRICHAIIFIVITLYSLPAT